MFDEGLGDDTLPVVVVEKEAAVDTDDSVADVNADANADEDDNDNDVDNDADPFHRRRNESESCSDGDAETGKCRAGAGNKREKDPEGPKDQGLVSYKFLGFCRSTPVSYNNLIHNCFKIFLDVSGFILGPM